jgi:S-formylglutathione hydrolase FrmB
MSRRDLAKRRCVSLPLARLILVLLIAVLAGTSSARAAGRAECNSIPSQTLGRRVAYCAILPPSYDSSTTRRFPVLYFLHGLGENAQVLLTRGGWDLIQDLWNHKEIGEFVIVTPEAGRTFYINSRNGRVKYEKFFIREFIPYIERRYRIEAQRRERGIGGVSMGGYGALHLALSHPAFFGSVSAHSPALIASLPDAKLTADEEDLLTRIVGTAFGTPFDPAYWYRDSPFTLVKDDPRPAGLKIYFDCGMQDEFGFEQGAQEFHELLVARGIPHEFHLYPGGHSWDYFLQHLPASLELHSRAFGYRQ